VLCPERSIFVIFHNEYLSPFRGGAAFYDVFAISDFFYVPFYLLCLDCSSRFQGCAGKIELEACAISDVHVDNVSGGYRSEAFFIWKLGIKRRHGWI
jgi:hypothetical protein